MPKPIAPKRRSIDPQLPPGRKKLLPTFISSGVAILVVMYAMGQFPQVNAFFSALDDTARTHNDEIVGSLIHLAPLGLLMLGAFGLAAMIVSSVRSRRKSV